MSRGAGFGLVAFVAGAALVVVLSLGATPPPPFDAGSTAPSGYAAIATILEQRGAEVDVRTATSVAQQGFGPGDVIVVPAPELASFAELDAFEAAADDGAVVVYGSPPPEQESSIQLDSLDEFVASVPSTERVEDDQLARRPAQPVPPGACSIRDYEDLGPIDVAFTQPIDPFAGSGIGESCFAEVDRVHVLADPVGEGTIITLAGPAMLTNARLWPDKENGGEPLDNAGLLVRPVEAAAASGPARVTFVRAEPSPDASIRGGEPSNPLRLLPTGVQAALVVSVVAFVIYAWGRSRRLGRVVRERVPVEIAGSELVAAVGDLLRRKGSPERAAASLRSEFRRRVGVAAGLGVAPDDAQLLAWLEGRHHLGAARLQAALSAPVTSTAALVELARSLDSISEEVTRVRHVP